MFLYPFSHFWKGVRSFFLMSERRNINITKSAFNSPKRSNAYRKRYIYIQKDHELKIRMKSLFRISNHWRPHRKTGIVAVFEEVLSISKKD